MKTLFSSIENGCVRATLLADGAELSRCGGERAAVESCIARFRAGNGIEKLALTRVTRMELREDGSLEFDFDAAIPPKVELGQYLVVEVYIPAGESRDYHVLSAVSENLRADIPEIYFERKLDGLVEQRREDVASRPAFSTLADMYAIMREANGELSLGMTDGELWNAASAAADDSSARRSRLSGMDDILDEICGALFTGSATEEQRDCVRRCLDRRAEEKRASDPEKLADESFGCYLRLAGKTMDELRAEFRADAVALVRMDLLIDEVAEREKLEIGPEEMKKALDLIADMYSMAPDEVLRMVGEEALRARLIRDKARAMIVDSAVAI